MKPMIEQIEDVVSRVTPETVVEAMGIPYRFRWEGRRSWSEWTDKEAHVVRMMYGPLNQMASAAATRICKRPSWPEGEVQREFAAHDYLRKLVSTRDRFVRRAWRLFSPMAC